MFSNPRDIFNINQWKTEKQQLIGLILLTTKKNFVTRFDIEDVYPSITKNILNKAY